MNKVLVKMMSGENLSDRNPSKSFLLVESHGAVNCARDDNGKPRIQIPTDVGKIATYYPLGNTYIIENGKTIATFLFKLEGDDVKKTPPITPSLTQRMIKIEETATYIKYSISLVDSPVIVPRSGVHTKDVGSAYKFHPVLTKLGLIDVYVLHFNSEVIIKDKSGEYSVALTYNEIMTRLSTKSSIDLSLFVRSNTKMDLDIYEVHFKVAKH